MTITDQDRCALALHAIKSLVNTGVVDALSRDLRLVHARYCNGDLDYITAWIRDGDDIYQPTLERKDGQQIMLKYARKDYDACEEIKQLREYDMEEILAEIEHHKNFGPWCPTLASNNLPDNVIPIFH